MTAFTFERLEGRIENFQPASAASPEAGADSLFKRVYAAIVAARQAQAARLVADYEHIYSDETR